MRISGARRRLRVAALLEIARRRLRRNGLRTRDAWLRWRRLRLVCLVRLAQLRRERLPRRRFPRRWFRRPTWRVREVHGAWRTSVRVMLEEDPEQFFRDYRMTPAMFHQLLARLTPRLQVRRVAGHLPPGERLAMTLLYLASGSYQKNLGYSVPPPTVSGVVRATCEAIWEELSPEVFPPLTQERIDASIEDFWEKWQFPNCFGAIDGRHCIVQKFPNSGSDWFNYHGTHSMVMMAVADANYRLLYVDIGARGRRSDGGVWDECSLREMIDNGELPLPPPKQLPGGWAATPPVLVADDAFPLGPHVMKPYPGQFLQEYQNIFNYRLSRPRRIVENLFAIMTSRWRILRRPLIASENTARAVLKAVCVLHNYFVLNQENLPPHQQWYCPPNLADIDGYGEFELPRFPEATVQSREGVETREHLADFFMGPGAVHWQWGHLRRQ